MFECGFVCLFVCWCCTFSGDERLFQPEEPGNVFERLVVELSMIFRGSREGGFFIVIGQRP